jgi:serine/alanine adding enzyme
MKVESPQHTCAGPFRIEPLADKQRAAWDEFVLSHPEGSIYHLAIWRDLITELFGHQTHYFCASRLTGEIVGILPLVRLKSRLFGDFLVSMPYFNYGGALGINTETEEALMQRASELAQELGCNHIEFRDTFERDARWTLRTDKVAMELALPPSVDQLWSDLGSNLRRKIKRPQKEGVQILHGNEELLPQFYRVFARNMRDLGTPVYPEAFFKSIIETFPNASSIIVLQLRRQPVAAIFLLGFKDRLEMPWVASVRKFNRLMINMLLYWEALRKGVGDGYEVFDFGRSTIDSGTYRFKGQWGARPKQLYWHYWSRDGKGLPGLTPDNPRYSAAIQIWRRLPLSLTNWLGPKIVKNLP